MFRPIRQKRYKKWLDAGFLPFEAMALSKVSDSVPYVANMRRKRKGDLTKHTKAGKSKAAWRAQIIAMYKRSGYTQTDKQGNEVYSPWAMLRDYEDRYKDRHPEYTSPFLKKQKVYRQFGSKYERGIEKYPRGRAYGNKRKPTRTGEIDSLF